MIATEESTPTTSAVRYPGVPEAMDGTAAVVAMETAASEAAGAYPITPSTQMGEGWAAAAAEGRLNVNGRRLIFFEPEGEHAAAAVTAGMAMMGLRSANFSSGQGIAYMHESLYPAVGKRLTYVLNMACRAMTKHALNVHAGHDDYHAIDDTGFFQVFAKNAQEAADLNLIAHRIAELSLNPGVCAQDGFLTSHVIESVLLPEDELVREYLGDPADMIESPTPAQKLIYGERRRRIPEVFDLDNPAMIGVVQNQDSYAQGVAAQRPFFFDHVAALADRAMAEYAALTGRRYRRASGYLMDDAEYVIVGQGSVVANAEAVADYLRRERGLAVGVLNVTMFRPFPSDAMSLLLAGKRAAVVLERTDQPLAAEAPLLREIRVAMALAVENGRVAGASVTHPGVPYPGVAVCRPADVPDFYSGCFGLGSRDLQAGDLIAAVDNMLADGRRRRQFYLGVEFVRAEDQAPPSLAEWQKKIVEVYPHVADSALAPAANVSLLPAGSLAVRIHSVGGWGAMTMGKNLTLTLFDLLGMHVKSNPKYGSEKKGQPTTFYGVFAHQPIRTNCELKHVDVVLSPDPNVFRHSNPLAGLAEGGTFVVQHDRSPEELWQGLPEWVRKTVRTKKIRVFHLDAFAIARAETDEPDLQFRMQGAAFQGAFFKASPVMAREGLEEERLFDAMHKQLQKKFGHRGPKVVEDNLRVIRRGFDEVRELDWAALPAVEDAEKVETASWEPPWYWTNDAPHAEGVGDPLRFAGQVCAVYGEGQDPIADPFAALSAIPAATGVMRDMTGIRFEVPEFIAEKCTGCGQCWTQCPDAAIPGLVSEVRDVVRAGVFTATDGRPSAALKDLIEPLAEASRRLLREKDDYRSFAGVVTRAYESLELELDADARAALDAELDVVARTMADFPVARTAPFFTVPERREEGSGGLLSVTVNPYACKGCNLCVEVCPDEALVAVKQDEAAVEKLRRNWEVWQKLPDTPDRFLQVSDLDQGIGVLHTLMLKKDNFHSMVGGDGSCMGCGEKTGIHLIVSAIEAWVRPRVAPFVERLAGLAKGLEHKAAELLMVGADLDAVASAGSLDLHVEVAGEDKVRLARISRLVKSLKDLHWRYVEGPSGRGRAALGIANSTGCSSVWGSTYPYNPYPYPWTNHLFQDAPSIAIGIFEGLMRKMADGFAAVRKAELELADAYEPAAHDAFFQAFDWRQFSDEEFHLCPPILAVGGDGAMLDIGFQNVSRLMASGKPIRVVVLDTQVYSNTGGQACTSGFHGQVSDMAAYGAARHGKEENRKEMALIAMAHRGAYVLQSSQALPSHLIGGVLRGLSSRRPAIFNLYSPCQAEHGLPDSGSARAAKLAVESRAFPYMVYDPDRGATFAERLDLDGNPNVEDTWPAYELKYTSDDGAEQTLALPLTIADWAATEPRFARHFKRVKASAWHQGMVPFHEYLELAPAEREGKVPCIYVRDREDHLGRMTVSQEMVELAADRLDLWDEVRELAGVKVSERVRRGLTKPLEREYEKKLAALRQEYEQKIAELKDSYPAKITRRIAEALVGGGLTGFGEAVPAAAPPMAAPPPAAEPVRESAASPEPARAVQVEPVVEAEEGEGIEPYVDTELCTTCNECTNLNPRMFAYNADKKAYVKDPRAGTFAQLVQAAEKCTARIIHPGTPLDPDEPDLEKWVKRAQPFN
ncbi:MAG TPA: 2-oxoacid:acceptor oxidoreductase family protein [Thermoanaerobaculia bacterium]